MIRNVWTIIEALELKVLYNSGFQNGDGRLDEFCTKHNRTKSYVCKQARLSGLTNKFRSQSPLVIERISKNTKEYIKKNGHPKGFEGKIHTAASRLIMGEKSSISWSDPNSAHNSEANKQRLSDLLSLRKTEGDLSNSCNSYSRVKHGKINIAGVVFYVRSSWEANIAAYLQFKVDKGLIKGWKYESKTFWFLEILRGVRSYKPDFEITNNDGSIYFIEVKGWMDSKSKTKLKRMEKYYPEVKVELLGPVEYKDISQNKKLYKYWGQL